MKKIGLFCAAASFFLIQPVKAELFNMSSYTLNNGMQLVVVPNHKAPIVQQMIWYKVGAADEKTGKGGTAHLLEHLMFRGTSKIKGQDFNRILEDNGAKSNAFTSQDFTVYHQFVDISRLELAMFLEADRMQNLQIDADSFETERKIVYQERKQVVENDPMYLFNEEMQRAFWQQHPYARPITGTEDEILNLTVEDVKDIYSRYYNPQNAVLVIAGDIEPDLAYKLAEKYYGNIENKGKRNQRNILPDKVKTNTVINMKLPQIDVPRLVRKYKAPYYVNGGKAIYPLMILSKYLGEGEISFLYNRLVIEEKIAASVSVSYNFAVSGGSFTIYAIPAKGIAIADLQKSVDEAVVLALKNLNKAELSKIKKQMLAGLIFVRDNPSQAAQIAGMLAAQGMKKDEIEAYAENIQNVTLDEVKKAAANVFSSTSVEGIALSKGDKK